MKETHTVFNDFDRVTMNVQETILMKQRTGQFTKFSEKRGGKNPVYLK